MAPLPPQLRSTARKRYPHRVTHQRVPCQERADHHRCPGHQRAGRCQTLNRVKRHERVQQRLAGPVKQWILSRQSALGKLQYWPLLSPRRCPCRALYCRLLLLLWPPAAPISCPPYGTPARLQAVSYVDRAPAPTVAIIERQPSAPISVDRRVEQGARQTGISSLHG